MGPASRTSAGPPPAPPPLVLGRGGPWSLGPYGVETMTGASEPAPACPPCGAPLKVVGAIALRHRDKSAIECLPSER